MTDEDPDWSEDDRIPIGVKDDRILVFIPEEGIDWDVIREDLHSYLGKDATVRRGKHFKDGPPGYLIRTNNTLTMADITDLRLDTIAWHDERRISGSREYRRSRTHERRQEFSPKRPLSDFRADRSESSSRRELNSIPPRRHQQNDDARMDAAEVSANYDDSQTSISRLPCEQMHPQAPNGPGQRSSTNLRSYKREDIERMVARKLKSEGYTEITRSQFERAVDQAIRKLQQPKTSTQPSYESWPVRRQMLNNETEAQVSAGDDFLGQSESGDSTYLPTLGVCSFEMPNPQIPTDFRPEGASHPHVCLSPCSSRDNSVLMNPTFSGKTEWHSNVVHEYEDSIMTESHIPALDHPKRLSLDDVPKMFAEIAGLILRLPELDKLPDCEKVRSISEHVKRRISIFKEAQPGIDEPGYWKPMEVSIREGIRRKLLELEDPGLQVSNTESPTNPVASAGQEKNVLNGSQTSRWESDLSTLLTKVDWEFMNTNVAIPFTAFCYSSLLSCCWSVSGVKFDSVASETTVIDHDSSSPTQQNLQYPCVLFPGERHPFPEPDCLFKHIRIAHTNEITANPRLRSLFERWTSYSNNGSQSSSYEQCGADADSGYASSIAPSKVSSSNNSLDSGFGSCINPARAAAQNPVNESLNPVNETQTSLDAPNSPAQARKHDTSETKPGTVTGASSLNPAIPSGASRATSPEVIQSPAHSLNSSLGSEGERSFACTSDSDWALEQWEAGLDPELIQIRSRLVQRLIETYTSTNFGICNEILCTAPSDPAASSHGSSNHSSSSLSRTTQSSHTSITKHKLCQEDDEGDLQDRDGPPRRKRSRFTTESISLDGRLFACPYTKFDPIRFSERNIDERHYRGCSSSYLSDISRLKQHLYRTHRKPDFYCRSCFEIFKSEAQLDSHTRKRPSCEPCEPQFAEKMSVEQMADVKRRKPGKTPADTWFAIFRILFPEAPLPQSPYADSVSSDAIRSFMDLFQRQARANLSSLIREQLGNTLVLHSDQQRLLDSALEISISQLVMRMGPGDQATEPQQVALESSEVGTQTGLDRVMNAPFANDIAPEPQMPQALDFSVANPEDDDNNRPLTWTPAWTFEGLEDIGDIESIFR